jgi:hypothetical protein
VVNACGSDGHAEKLAGCVDFAIGHAAPVYDKDALLFSGTFYECVCRGMSLAGSFDTARSAASPGYRMYAKADPLTFCPGGAGNDGPEGPRGGCWRRMAAFFGGNQRNHSRASPPPHGPPTRRPVHFYHGTSLEAAMNIQENGFDVSLSGTNAGQALGRGLYVTSSLEKALNYAKRMPCNGAVFQLRVELGYCYTVNANDSNRQNWQQMGYDSAWARAGIIGEREETCIKDPRPPRVVIKHICLGHTGEANSAGYWVDQEGKLRKR